MTELRGGQFWKQLGFPYNRQYVVYLGRHGREDEWAVIQDPREQGNIAQTDYVDGEFRGPLWTSEELEAWLKLRRYTCQGQFREAWLEDLAAAARTEGEPKFEEPDGDGSRSEGLLLQARQTRERVAMQPYDQVKILDEILEERTRQDEKWGPIDDVWDRSPLYWLAILTEELGEVAKAMIEPTYIDIASDGVRQELIQTAAVAVSWLEAIDHATEARR